MLCEGVTRRGCCRVKCPAIGRTEGRGRGGKEKGSRINRACLSVVAPVRAARNLSLRLQARMMTMRQKQTNADSATWGIPPPRNSAAERKALSLSLESDRARVAPVACHRKFHSVALPTVDGSTAPQLRDYTPAGLINRRRSIGSRPPPRLITVPHSTKVPFLE